MNILFYYIKTYAPINGGIANVSLWLAGHFVEMGHNVILLSRKPTTKAVFRDIYQMPMINMRWKIELRLLR